ncbi:MAG: hypothetical protein AABY22_19475 [Nanoarchaeota archaeon]
MMAKLKIKGELTTTQIVTVVILILSFAVILFFIYQLGFKEQSQREICRNSVELKAKDILGVGSLNCRTEYLCLTSGEKCTEDLSAKVVKVNDKEAVKQIADAIYDCWWQYGQGEKEFVSWGTNRIGNPKECGICNQVYLNGIDFEKQDILEYISSNKEITLKNSLIIPEGFNFNMNFVILYEVEQEGQQQISVNYIDKIKEQQCDGFFNLA